MLDPDKPFFQIYDNDGKLDKDWFVFYYVGGKRIKKYTGINKYASTAERRKAAAALIEKLSKEFGISAQNPYKKVIQDYIDSNKQWRKKTASTYQSVANTYFEFLGTKAMNTKNTMAFFADLKTKVSAVTYNKYVEKLRTLLKAIDKEKVLPRGISKLKASSQPARYFQSHEKKMLADHIKKTDKQLYLCIQLYHNCGLRTREMLPLKASNFMLDEAKIFIPGSVAKNGKSRYAKIPKSMLPGLSYIKQLPSDTYLFEGKDPDKHLGQNTLGNRHRKVLQQFGFSSEYSLYSWRHTGVVQMAKDGLSILEIKIHLDHHSLDQTQAYLRQLGIDDFGGLDSKFEAL